MEVFQSIFIFDGQSLKIWCIFWICTHNHISLMYFSPFFQIMTQMAPPSCGCLFHLSIIIPPGCDGNHLLDRKCILRTLHVIWRIHCLVRKQIFYFLLFPFIKHLISFNLNCIIGYHF